jgi:hypothetical protein
MTREDKAVTRTTRGLRRPTSPLWLALAAGALLLSGCRGESRPNVTILGGSSASVSGADDPSLNAASAPRYRTSTQQDLALQAALDLRDLRSVINPAIDGRPVDWERARAIYERGKNQARPDGSLRSLASLADDEAQAAFPNGAAVYGRAGFLDGIIRDGLNGTGRAQGLSDDARRAIVDRGVQVVLYARGMRGLAVTKTKVEAKAPDAAASLDETWAMIAGAPDSEGLRSHGLLRTASDRETDFKITGRLAQPLEDAFIAGLASVQKGDAAAFTRQANDAVGLLNATFALTALRAAQRAEAATTAEARAVQLADGWASFQAIRAAVAAAREGAASPVEAALTRAAAEAFPASETATVTQALNDPAVRRALNIPDAIPLTASAARS